MGWEPLTENDQLRISAVVHQNYYMPDVFETVASIVRAHVAEAEDVAAKDAYTTGFDEGWSSGYDTGAEQQYDEV